jgi:histone deacetylase 11
VTAFSIATGIICWPFIDAVLAADEDPYHADSPDGPVPLIYSSGYNISAFGIERLHPFDGNKFRKIQTHLIHEGLRAEHDFQTPEELSPEMLNRIHSPAYLESLKDSRVLAKIFEVSALALMPANLLDWGILRPMRLAGGGTVVACRLALQNG